MSDREIKLAVLTSTMSAKSGGLAIAIPAMAFAINPSSVKVSVLGLRDRAAPSSCEGWGPSVFPQSYTGPESFGYSAGYTKALNALSPDIIDSQGVWQYPSLANLRYHMRTHTPYVVTPHGMLEPWALERSRWKKSLAGLWFENQHLRLAQCLRATAEMEAASFRQLGLRNPIAIIPNGVFTPPATYPVQRSGKRRLLFLSRVHPKKGLPILLRAWARLRYTRREWELVIAGPDEVNHLAEVKLLAEQLHLSDVIWHPPVEGSSKDALYRSSDLFVLPSHSENFGLVVAEALANGVPVITTKNTPWAGLRDHRCGWWINLTEDELFSTLAEATSCPPQFLQEMGRRGHAWMLADFSWHTISERLIELYSWVVHKGSPPSFVFF